MTFIPYTLIRSNRKTISIRITPAGEVQVRCPSRMSKKDAEAFLESKRDWVLSHLPKEKPVLLTESQLQELVAQAKADLPPRVQFWSKRIRVSYGSITIRRQHTRWGSCTAKGNLNFNCLLMLCPEEIREYVVIHELCHRRHMDHSPAFWAQVARYCPRYQDHRQWLKTHGSSLIGRLP